MKRKMNYRNNLEKLDVRVCNIRPCGNKLIVRLLICRLFSIAKILGHGTGASKRAELGNTVQWFSNS